MKNENIAPGQLVPEEIRLECYIEALRQLEAGESRYRISGFSSCLRLPCILWDLESVGANAPNGAYWGSEHTEKMFPEMEGISAAVYGLEAEDRYPIRKSFLENAIQKLRK